MKELTEKEKNDIMIYAHKITNTPNSWIDNEMDLCEEIDRLEEIFRKNSRDPF